MFVTQKAVSQPKKFKNFNVGYLVIPRFFYDKYDFERYQEIIFSFP